MTSTEQEFDVAVVGASLAGCATAILLGRAGLRVALIDKHSGPDAYKRLCGHYIQASATPVIRAAGPGRADRGRRRDPQRRGSLDALGHHRFARGAGRSGRTATASAARSSIPLIRRLAAETPGRRIPARPQGGRACSADDEHVTGVELRDRARRPLRIRARLVVGADGRNSTVGAPGRRPRTTRWKRALLLHGVLHWRGAAGRALAGAFLGARSRCRHRSPNDDGVTLLAVFLHKRRLPEFRGDREPALRALFAALPEAPELSRAERADKIVGYTDYGIVSARARARPGLALVGDAALTCDPVMAIGCGWALQSGAWLADSVAPALTGEEPLRTALRRYRREHRRRLNGHHRMLTADARAPEPESRAAAALLGRRPRCADGRDSSIATPSARCCPAVCSRHGCWHERLT